MKRTASNDKSDGMSQGFHSTASRGLGRTGVKMLEGVQELDGISAQDDEQNRLYHEEYGSQASQEDGDRWVVVRGESLCFWRPDFVREQLALSLCVSFERSA